MLLCAIISDTLNLMGPTTTQWDRMMVAILAIIAGVDDINTLASQQFKAKSRELAGMSATQLCSGDCKVFKLVNGKGIMFKIGFAVVETTDDDVIMERKNELLPELKSSKFDKGLDFLFLAVVNIVEMRSNLLMCSSDELSLAKFAYGGTITSDGVMEMGNRVSRKKEFVPPISSCIVNYDRPSKSDKKTPSGNKLAQLTSIAENPSELYVDPSDPLAMVQRKYLNNDSAAEVEDGAIEF
jgi:manganese-dependent inorganic pyrophosphatase